MSERIEEGGILYSSWGYEQTNVDWYRVERITKQFAILQRLGSNEESDGAQSMTGRSLPNEDVMIGNRFRRKIHSMGETDFVCINDYAYAYVSDGQPRRFSCYA